jgi:hypothetical protein
MGYAAAMPFQEMVPNIRRIAYHRVDWRAGSIAWG